MIFNISTVGVEKLSMDRYRCDRIRTANHYLTNYLTETVSVYPDLGSVLDITADNVDVLNAFSASKVALMSTPFSMVTPTLTEMSDWQCLVKNSKTVTTAVAKIRIQMPTLTEADGVRLLYSNREFSNLICELLHRSAVAAPLLGISPELAKYLRSLSPHALDLGIQRAGFPLFRWRLNSAKFWIDFRSGHLSIDSLGHHIMASTPARANSFRPSSPGWAAHIDPVMKPVYCDLMIRQRHRAACIADILGLPVQQVRDRFRQFHGTSSPPGHLPKSRKWYFESVGRRLQATMLARVHRAARAFDFNPLESAMAAYELLAKFFGKTSQLNPERAMLISHFSETGAALDLATCRQCETPYLISNSFEKIESRRKFQCPGCTGKLAVVPREHGKRRTRPR